MQLFGCHSHGIKDLVGHQDRCPARIIGIQTEAVHHCHIFHIPVRHILKHLPVGLCRNNLHHQLIFHAVIIGDLIHVKVRRLLNALFHNLDRLIYQAVI